MATNVVVRSAGRLVNAFGRGYDAATGADRPGWAGKVSPFEYGTVTPGAIALKSLASLIYGQRAAANAKLLQESKVRDAQYRDLQMQNLQRQITPKPTRRVSIPGVGDLDLTDEQIAAHATAIAGKPPTPEKRVHIPKAEAERLGVPYDDATGTVSQADELAGGRRLVREGVEKRFQQGLGLREQYNDRAKQRFTQATAMSTMKMSQAALEALDKEAAAAAKDAALKGEQEADNAIRQLGDPALSPQRKSYYAKALGLPLAKMVDPQDPSKTVAVHDPNGNPMYDLSPARIRMARQNYVQRMQDAALSQTKAAQSAYRLFHAGQIRDAGGYLGGGTQPAGPDPYDDVRALMQMYGQPAENDSTYLDTPAR